MTDAELKQRVDDMVRQWHDSEYDGDPQSLELDILRAFYEDWLGLHQSVLTETKLECAGRLAGYKRMLTSLYEITRNEVVH